jgi:hypothetical protein
MASSTSRNTLIELGTDPRSGGTSLHHAGNVVVLVGGIYMVRIDGTNVRVATVHATLNLPLIDDLFQPGTRTP